MPPRSAPIRERSSRFSSARPVRWKPFFGKMLQPGDYEPMSLETEEPDYPTFADGPRSLWLGDAFVASSRERRWVTLKLANGS